MTLLQHAHATSLIGPAHNNNHAVESTRFQSKRLYAHQTKNRKYSFLR